MARIDTYEQRVGTPSGTVSGGKENISLPHFQLDTESINQGIRNIAQARERTDMNNARAELAALDPEAQLAFRNEFNRLSSSWQPGQAPIAQQMDTFISQYADTAEQRMSSEVGRGLIRERANDMRGRYMLLGADAQLGIETDVRVGQYGQGYDAIAGLASTQPAALGPELAKLNATVMADDMLPLARRQALVQQHSRTTALAVGRVQAESNPQQTLAIANRLLGIVEPTLSVRGDVTEAIVRNESGGRMYADSGEILRGPAITTRDGRTIHAYGKYQLLEDTAREQAKRLGIAWDRDLFLRDRTGDAAKDAETAAYHDQLGQAYIADQQREFGGNPILTAAAHNMGPEATRGWAAGRPYQTQSGKWWYPKQPMDMAALPDETRAYISKLGEVKDMPASAQIPVDDESLQTYRILAPEDLLSIRSAAQSRMSELNRQNQERFAVDRVLFQQRIDDLTATAKAGDPIEIPGMDEMVTFLGPAQALLKTRQLAGYQQMAAGLKQLPGLSNAELQAISEMPDPEGSEDRENRQFIRDTTAARAKELLAQRNSDPGKAALSASPDVQQAYTQWQQAARAFHEAGQGATPEQYAAVNAAQSRYVTTSFAQQRQWGIIEPKLPNDVVTGLSKSFVAGLDSGDPALSVARYAALPQQLGSYEAIKQVGDKTGDTGWFAMEGVSADVVLQLRQARAIKSDEAAKLLPNDIKTADVRTAVQKSFAPLLSSLGTPGLDQTSDNAAATRYYNGGVTLATQYLISGQASNVNEAAGMAYQQLYANRETIVNGVRIPNNFDAEAVTVGMARRLQNIRPEHLFLQAPSAGLTEGETRQRMLRNVQQNGRWVTNETGDGAYLMVAGRPALDRAGRPMEIKFQQAQSEPMPATEQQMRQDRAQRAWGGRGW